jgi:hypothetical protein
MAARPQPRPDADTAEFWARLDAGEFALQACDACGRIRFYPQPLCPHCRSLDYTWKPLSGRGTVASWTIVHHAVNAYFKPRVPYSVVLVSLEEDPSVRLIGNLTASSERRPLHQGDRVQLRILDAQPDQAAMYEFETVDDLSAASADDLT